VGCTDPHAMRSGPVPLASIEVLETRDSGIQKRSKPFRSVRWRKVGPRKWFMMVGPRTLSVFACQLSSVLRKSYLMV
jgi:hypothetical protein